MAQITLLGNLKSWKDSSIKRPHDIHYGLGQLWQLHLLERLRDVHVLDGRNGTRGHSGNSGLKKWKIKLEGQLTLAGRHESKRESCQDRVFNFKLGCFSLECNCREWTRTSTSRVEWKLHPMSLSSSMTLAKMLAIMLAKCFQNACKNAL